jgi:hypothetical protein
MLKIKNENHKISKQINNLKYFYYPDTMLLFFINLLKSTIV